MISLFLNPFQPIIFVISFPNHTKNDQGKMSEVENVSQLYETVTLVQIFFMLTMECVAYYFQLWPHFETQKLKSIEEETEWNRNRGYTVTEQRKQKEAENQAEKGAVDELNKEITNIERQIEERESQEHPEQAKEPERELEQAPEAKQEEGKKDEKAPEQLTDRQKSILSSYMIFGKFMNEHTPIILSTLVLGFLANSTLVFTLACYFCYMFCNVLFDFIQVEERIRKEYKRGIVTSRLVKLLSSMFVIAILFSYWTINQY